MTETTDDTSTSRGRRSKVERLIESDDLAGIGDELAVRWRGKDRERESLRDLADRFNRELLRARMEASGIDAVEDEIATAYRVLTDESTDSGSRTQLRRRLERDGLDLDELMEDFVSRQAIHTYLTRVRGMEAPSNDDDPIERDRRTIRQLLTRTESVTADKIARHRSDGTLKVGEFRVTANVRVLCTDCGSQFDADELLSVGACECE